MQIYSNSKLAFQIPLYDYLKHENYNSLSSGLIAKVGISLVFYPYDLIKNNQRESKKVIPIKNICKNIYNRDGFRGFYKGISLYTCCSTPNFIIMMMVKDYLLNKKI